MSTNGNVTVSAVPLTNREKELRQLLAEERQRSEQRKENYLQLRDEQIKLRKDYLALQTEIKSILEETKVLKKQKEDELEEARKKIDQQNELIERLRKDLGQRDPDLIEQQLKRKLLEPQLQLEKEKVALIRERDQLASELKLSQQKVKHIEKEMINAVERVKLSYEAEINLIRKEKEELKVKLLEITKTPEGQQILFLTDEVEKLSGKLRSKEKALEEATRQYTKIQDTIENFNSEQEKLLIEHERQIELLRGQLTASREDNIKLDDIVKHLRREKDNLKREIKRLERDQAQHQEMLVNMEKCCDQEKERLRRTFVKEKTDLEVKRDGLSDEIKRLKVDLELKNETIGRLEKTVETKDKDFEFQVEVIRQRESNAKNALERERVSLDKRIAEANEEKNGLKAELEDCKRLMKCNDESRMNLEKEVMILKAKVESVQSFQDEVDRLRRNQANCLEELDKVRNELAITSAVKENLTIQLQRSEEDYNRIKVCLEEERNKMIEFKDEKEKMISRLRSCLEEERNEMRVKFEQLTDEYKRKHKERDDMKAKCKQYQSAVEKLQGKVKLLEGNINLLEKSVSEMVPIKVYKELKKQYKDLKRQINDLPTLNLTNHTQQHCSNHQQKQQQQQPALSSSILSQHCIKVNKTTREKQTTSTS